MNKRGQFFTTLTCLLVVVPVFLVAKAQQTPEELARQILDATGVKGGLIVHFNCGDGTLTVALHKGNSYYVHGLDTNEANVATARAYIKSQGLYGDEVMVEQFDGGRLPYIENLVNLLVSEQPLPFDDSEILRVLAPNGVAYTKGGNDWTMMVKPWPAEIDEWTHHLYDASNNAVSHDMVVDPPERVQWIGSPKWSRHHDRMSSVGGYVSAHGRNFYIIDEGSKVSPQLPSKWRLYARDAFNGTILWSKPVGEWVTHMWPFKSGPTQPARRLVAIDDILYATLGLDGTGLSKVDAATGNVLWTAPNSVMTEEFIYSDSVLFAVVKDNPPETGWNNYRPKPVGAGPARDNVAAQFPWDERERIIAALDASNGSAIWRVTYPVAPMTLAADAECIYFHDGASIVCLDKTNGSHNWTSAVIARQDPMPPRFGPTLVVQDNYIVFLGGDNARTITCLSAKTGAVLWSENNHPRSGHFSPYDLFVINGQAWTGATAGGGDTGNFTSWDLKTGASTVWPSDTDIYFMHQRCHRQKATDRWIIASRTGTEFVDTTTGHWVVNHWTRSGCVFGLVPANGFINITPHNCACYFQSKTFGFTALAPAHSNPNYPQAPSPANRLIQGPAYGEPLGPDAGAEDWPTYRCDAFRTGYIESVVPADVELSWETQIGGQLSALTVAGSKVYVASIEEHTLYALDDTNGQTLWTYMTGGRIDSPPTIYKSMVIFGCADGYIYCLRETDGALIWKFQAAPENLRMTSFEQVESVWPVHGSVLVVNDEVYCVAGRIMFLDGGLRFLRIDPETGALIDEVVLDEKDPDTGQNLQVHVKNKTMPVALPDILSSDGEFVFMRKQRFDFQGNRYEIAPISSNQDTVASDQYGVGVHLFSNAGFLEDSYMHRTYWIWGRSWSSGAGGYYRNGRYAPAGRVMVIGPDRVYGYGRRGQYYKWSIPLEYELFCAEKYPESKTIEYHWTNTDIPILANSIALADKTLWIAGPPDVVDEEVAFDFWTNPGIDPDIPAKLDEQDAAFEGQRGALLRAVSALDGNSEGEYNLESPPVWDGMAVANGRLYLALENGKVLSLVGSNYPPEVDAGEDRTIYPMATAVLDATVTDDGFPKIDPCDPYSAPIGVTTGWSKFAGPGQVTFGDPCAVDTTASFSQWGQYTLRLTAFDGRASYYDDINIFVTRPGDIDLDKDIDILDLVRFVAQWLRSGCGALNDWCSGADQTANGSVNSGDYSIMAENWLSGVEPAAPMNLVAEPGDSRISLDWDDNTEADLAGYNVYRSVSRGVNYTKVNQSLLTSSQYTDTDVSNCITYYYVVTAEDTFGYHSGYSDEVSASPGTQPVMKLMAGIGVTSFRPEVSRWQDQANNNHAYQDTQQERPAFVDSGINGKPAIEFDGTGVHLDVADSKDINTGGPYPGKTLVVVFRTASNVTSRQVIWEQGGGTRGLSFYLDNSKLYINGWNLAETQWGPTGLNTPVSANTTYVATLVVNAGAGTFEGFVNGTRIGSVSGIAQLYNHSDNCAFGHKEGGTKFHDGTSSGTGNFAGLIAEFYVYNAVLPNSDRRTLENALMSSYVHTPASSQSLADFVEGFETNDFSKFPWEQDRYDIWTVTSSQRHSGAYSAQAGSIDHDQNTTLQVTLNCVSGDITFYRKVSSEPRCDYLRFYIDGAEKGKWAGEEAWAQASFDVTAGSRTFKWTYSKDGSESAGYDTAWIDDIVFPIE